jgi:hypothetical protein
MKRNILLGALAVILVAACGKKPETSEAPSSPEPDARVAATTTVPAPTPEANYFAPEGVFFLVEKITLETKDGIMGYPPGTKVLRQGAAFMTPDGVRISPRSDQMTNDLRIAQRAAGSDAAAQAAVKNTLASMAPPDSSAGAPLPPGARSTTFSTIRTGPDGSQTVHETTTVHTVINDPVTAQLKELEKQRQLLEVEISRQYAQLRTLTNRNPRKSPEAEQITQQIAALREKVRAIDEQKAVVRASR